MVAQRVWGLFAIRLIVGGALVSVAHGAAPGHWWEQGVSRLVSVSVGFAGPDKFDPTEMAARKAALGFDAERLTVNGRWKGMDDTRFYFVTSAGSKTNENYLRRYLPEAKKRGLRVAIHFDVHHYNADFAGQHPDWMQRNENGSIPKIYDTGLGPCINSPFRDWVFQVLRDLARIPNRRGLLRRPDLLPRIMLLRALQAKVGGTASSRANAFKEAAQRRDFLRAN